MNILFLCDQEADCKTSPRCWKECIRTTKIEHAKNFTLLSANEEKSAYIEKDDKTVCHLDSPCPYQDEEIKVEQPEDWMERNKERILQSGMEGREIEFRIGGRLFAIREKAQ